MLVYQRVFDVSAKEFHHYYHNNLLEMAGEFKYMIQYPVGHGYSIFNMLWIYLLLKNIFYRSTICYGNQVLFKLFFQWILFIH